MTASQTFFSSLNQWGNGTAVRLNKTVLNVAGFTQGTAVRLLVEPGRIVLEEVRKRPNLEDMLAAFDPNVHGGEAMAVEPVGREVV